MALIKELWARDKPLVIVFAVALAAILFYVYKQNAGGQGQPQATSTQTGTNSPNSETPSVVTDQLSTIIAALGHLTPVTNSTTTVEQPVNTTIISPTVMPPPITTTLTTPPVTQTVTSGGLAGVIAGIGNDTARDAAIRVAEAKYKGPSQAVALHDAIAKIQAQYPRSGPTI